MSIITINIQNDNVKLDELISIVKNIGETMATQTDVDMLTAQVTKVMTEVVTAKDMLMAEIVRLQAIIDAGLPVLDLTGLTAALQVLDDLHPDVPPVV